MFTRREFPEDSILATTAAPARTARAIPAAKAWKPSQFPSCERRGPCSRPNEYHACLPFCPRLFNEIPEKAMKTLLIFLTTAAAFAAVDHHALGADKYHSPYDVAFSHDGRWLVVSDHTANAVVLIDPVSGQVTRTVSLEGPITGVAFSADGKRLYAAEFGLRRIAEIDPAVGNVTRRFDAGPYPKNLAVAPDKDLLLVASWGTNRLRAIDLASGDTKAQVALANQPFDLAVTPDASLAVVGNLLPVGRATDFEFGAVVSLVDLAAMKKRTDVTLPNGSSAVRGLAVGPDGRWAYVIHTLGRYNVPTTQVERGWVNTNALSVIDLADATRHATVLLDHPTHGAADPWGMAISDDGRWLCVTLSGTHELGRIDLAALWELLETGDRATLINDLSGLHRTNVIRRIPIGGKGPRGVALSPDGEVAAVAVYFSGEVALVDTSSGKTTMVPLGKQPAVDPVRMGERVFHDGTRCFQHWLSCATCHPDGRVDGLNWDLLNDGLGNPKNAKSMVWSHRAPPVMSRGVRDKMETAAKAGFTHIQFTTPSDEELAATIAYIKSLEPLASPYRNADGSLTEAAKRGEAIFSSATTRCAVCHPPPLLTDLKLHNVGTRQEMDQSDLFDTPSLIELWRTAPYGHDGGAADMREMLIDRNPKDWHGRTSHLSSQEIDDLIEYLLSL